MAILYTIMAAKDRVTRIPIHRSTLLLLQRVKSAAESWDEFLIAVTDDFLAPALKAELDRRLVSDRVVSGSVVRREFERRRRRTR
jgi:hypothetical protein